jgi:pimeloyl-ACP methyl ester carboxylesterase
MYTLLTLDLRKEAEALKVPVLVIEAKLNVPAEGWPAYEAAWHAQIDKVPDHQAVVIDTAHHYVMLDAPEPFYQALDGFLAQHGH